MKTQLSKDELLVPPNVDRLDEAADLLLQLGSREQAIQRYKQLMAINGGGSTVSRLAASKLKTLIERADDLNAWSLVNLRSNDDTGYLLDQGVKVTTDDLNGPISLLLMGSRLSEVVVLRDALSRESGGMVYTEVDAGFVGFAPVACRDIGSLSTHTDSWSHIFIYRSGDYVHYKHGNVYYSFNAALALWVLDVIIGNAYRSGRHYKYVAAPKGVMSIFKKFQAIPREIRVNSYSSLGNGNGSKNVLLTFVDFNKKPSKGFPSKYSIGDTPGVGGADIDISPICESFFDRQGLLKLENTAKADLSLAVGAFDRHVEHLPESCYESVEDLQEILRNSEMASALEGLTTMNGLIIKMKA